MIKTHKEVDPSAKIDPSFTNTDLNVANTLTPAHIVIPSDYKIHYIFERKLITINDIIDMADTTKGNQTARSAYNPSGDDIFNSMKESGINLRDVTIVVNPTSDNNYEIVDGYGRYESLKHLKYKNVMAFVPTSRIKSTDKHILSQQLNDHEPRSSVTAPDIIDGCLKVLLKGEIRGISKSLAKRFNESDPSLTDKENEDYSRAIHTHVCTAGRNNHRTQSIDSMVSKITTQAKLLSKSDVHLMEHDGSLKENLVGIGQDLSNNTNIVLPLLSDGTRKAENVFGSIVNTYSRAVEKGDANCIEQNSEAFLVNPESVKVIIGLSRWKPSTSFSKMKSIKKIYQMKEELDIFVKNIEAMTHHKGKLFTDKNKIPRISIEGFICPWLPLQKYGWPFKGLVTYDNHLSFNEVITLMYRDKLLTEREMKSLIK